MVAQIRTVARNAQSMCLILEMVIIGVVSFKGSV